MLPFACTHWPHFRGFPLTRWITDAHWHPFLVSREGRPSLVSFQVVLRLVIQRPGLGWEDKSGAAIWGKPSREFLGLLDPWVSKNLRSRGPGTAPRFSYPSSSKMTGLLSGVRVWTKGEDIYPGSVHRPVMELLQEQPKVGPSCLPEVQPPQHLFACLWV